MQSNSIKTYLKSIKRFYERQVDTLKQRQEQESKKLQYSGQKYFCPVCSSSLSTLFPFGDPPRENVLCPVCSSLERHRLDWLFIQNKTNLLDGSPKKMLHIAPETCLEPKFREIKNLKYITGDLMSPRAMLKIDITDIQFPDNTFDVIYCSHVLEHIPDDRKAIREFYRVCKSGGWAILQVPISAGTTFEDQSIVTPEDRKRVFGQNDHVRLCGLDYIERIREGGFEAELLYATDIVDETECNYYGFQKNRVVFYCKKVS